MCMRVNVIQELWGILPEIQKKKKKGLQLQNFCAQID